jgi:site-specific recombinase XerD
MNVVAISSTLNTAPIGAENPAPGCDPSLSFLTGNEKVYATNLILDWQRQLQHLDGALPKTCKGHKDDVFRLLNHARVPPWELKKDHVSKYLDSRCNPATATYLAPSTVAGYCSAWRSFQNYMLDPDRANEILSTFQVRPRVFINEENGVSVKNHKANWKPKGWALTPDQIDAIDETFRFQIQQAHASRSKTLLPLIRDRVMFHVAIHFALRVSELVTCQMSAFKPSHEAAMERFGKLGTLTVTGKNQVTGTIPMREQQVYELLDWYIRTIRPKMLLRRKIGEGDSTTCKFEDKAYRVGELLFISERGGVVSPNTFRERLTKVAIASGIIANKLTPHILRHTGCTLMVPLYSPEVAQKYVRHKHLHTTLYYYHPATLDAGNEVNAAMELFDDEDEDEE